MSWFRWIVFFAMIACSTGAAMAEEEKEEDISIECWKGSYLTGFTGHAGYVIDRMSIVCARWNPQKGRLDKPIHTTPGLVGRSGGGDPLDDALCPQGWAVAGGYSIDYALHDGREVLHHFDFNCRPVGGEGDLQPLRFGSNSNADVVFKPNSRRRCADGELATGIKARHARFIVDWELICARSPSVILLPKQGGRDILRDRGAPPTRKGGAIIVGDAGQPNTPPQQPPPVEKAETTNDTDVYRKTGAGTFVRIDDDPAHFLPKGFVAPVVAKEGGWWKLDLANVAFVQGEGWVAADQLKPNP